MRHRWIAVALAAAMSLGGCAALDSALSERLTLTAPQRDQEEAQAAMETLEAGEAADQAPEDSPSGEMETPEEGDGEEPEEVPPEEQVAALITPRGEEIAEKKRENSAVVGWLTVPGTDIDTVVVQNPEGNNDYYTNYDFYDNPSRDGTYGADFRCSFPTMSRNTPLYAHNHDENPDGILFAQLKRFKDPDFAREHPYIFFSTEEEDMVWEIFAIYDATVDLPYVWPDLDWEDYAEILEAAYAASIYDYGYVANSDDTMLTLSTCSFNVPGHDPLPIDTTNIYRYVIMARRVDPQERAKEAAEFNTIDNPVAPDDLPPFTYFNEDVLVYGDSMWSLATELLDNEFVELASKGDLELLGEINRGRCYHELDEWDASQLEEGTPVYAYPGFDSVLYAEVDGELLPYVPQEEGFTMVSATLTLENGGRVLKRRSVTEEEQLEALSRYLDMSGFRTLADDPDQVSKASSSEYVRIRVVTTAAVFVQDYYLASPSSMGQEVLVVSHPGGLSAAVKSVYNEIVSLVA